MPKITVWAPIAKEVTLEIAGKSVPMHCGDNGWFSIDVAEATHGADYAFRVDGSDPLPDPRSPWQPHGVLGPSRVVDHAKFDWTDQEWSSISLGACVVYEMHIGTFTEEGTFDAAIEKIDHLKDLGVTHVELMPVAEFVGDRGWGYDSVDLFAPHHAYGGPEGLKRFINACHEKHMGVIHDVVYNHLGPTGNFLSRFGPYFMKGMPNVWGEPINFSGHDSDEVRRYFIDNALMWLRDYHMDGLRLDAIQAIIDPTAVNVLEQLSAEVDALEGHLRRNTVIMAESNLNDPRIVRPAAQGGYGIDSQWNDDFHHALHSLLTGDVSGYYEGFGALETFATTMERAFFRVGAYSPTFRRRHGRPVGEISGHRFVVFMQNHDQIGNRPGGERSSHLLNPDQLKIGAALVFMSPFLPLLFMGEEWGASTPFCYFTDHHDPALADAVREGRRNDFSQFGWDPDKVPDPQDIDTFHKSKLNWDELDRDPHKSLLQWHKDLAGLRRRLPDLTDGRMDGVAVEFNEDERWLVIYRGAVTVACNMSDTARRVPRRPQSPGDILMASKTPQMRPGGMTLPPVSVVILGPAKEAPLTFQSFSSLQYYHKPKPGRQSW